MLPSDVVLRPVLGGTAYLIVYSKMYPQKKMRTNSHGKKLRRGKCEKMDEQFEEEFQQRDQNVVLSGRRRKEADVKLRRTMTPRQRVKVMRRRAAYIQTCRI